MKAKYTKIIAGITAIALSAGATLWYADERNSRNISAHENTAEEITEEISEYTKPTVSKHENTSSLSKSETVYVKASASGKAQNITVSGWIKNPEACDVIEDICDLNGIVNVKGCESFEQNGSNVKWQANGSDIYYQGQTEKSLPVSLNIRYYLNGQEISPSDIAGKSGNVKIRFEYENNEKRTINIDGTPYSVNIPFAAVTGLMLDTERFSNIETENGKVISDGKRCIAVGYAVPGLSDSLALSNNSEFDIDTDLPEYFEITADVNDFSLETTVTLITNELFDIPDDISAEGLKDKINELTSSADKLTDGTSKLYDGIFELLSKSEDMKDGIDKLADGADTLNSGISQISEGAFRLMQSTPVLTSGSAEFYKGLNTLCEKLKTANADTSQVSQLIKASAEIKAGIQKLNEGASQLAENTSSEAMKNTFSSKGLDTDALCQGNKECIDTLTTQITALSQQLSQIADVPEYTAQAEQLRAQIESLTQIITLLGGNNAYIEASQTYTDTLGTYASQLYDGTSSLSASYEEFDKAITQLAEKLSQTAESISQLREAVNALADAYGKINSGIGAYSSGIQALYDGSKKLSDGAAELSKGLNSLRDGGNALVEGVGKLSDGSEELRDGMAEFNEKGIEKIADLINNDLTNTADRAKAISKASSGYSSFSGLSDSMSGSVKFIIETDGI